MAEFVHRFKPATLVLAGMLFVLCYGCAHRETTVDPSPTEAPTARTATLDDLRGYMLPED